MNLEGYNIAVKALAGSPLSSKLEKSEAKFGMKLVQVAKAAAKLMKEEGYATENNESWENLRQVLAALEVEG